LKGFIDGDFVETFTQLTSSEKEAVLTAMNLGESMSLEALERIIEEVSRVH
jgi:hypothetical protein